MAKKEDKQPKEKKAEIDPKLLEGLSPLERFRAVSLHSAAKDPGSVMPASDFDANLQFLRVPDLYYQYALKRPGYALGRIQSLMGFEGASKTSMQLWKANLAMNQGGLAAAVFVEHADSTFHMKQYIEQKFMPYFMCHVCPTLEDAIDKSYLIQEHFEKVDPSNTLPKVQIFDSVAGATQEKLLDDEHEPGAPKPGGIGGIMAEFVNSMKTRIYRSQTLWVVNNQARKEIEIGFGSGQPKAEIDTMIAKGGRALPFHSTYQEVVKRRGALKATSEFAKHGKTLDGFNASIHFKKNKLGVPGREVYYDIVWDQGVVFSETLEWLAASKTMGLMKVSGKSKFYSRQMELNEADALPHDEMYELIHSELWLAKFQKELEIVTEIDAPTGLGLVYRMPGTQENPPPPPPPPKKKKQESASTDGVQTPTGA